MIDSLWMVLMFWRRQQLYQQNMDDHRVRVPFGKLTSIFPQIVLPHNINHEPVKDFIDKIVRELPVPTDLEISSTILSMKKVVDAQELSIQMQMMRQEDEHPHSPPPSPNIHTILEASEYEQNSHQQHQAQDHFISMKEWKWNEDEKDFFDFIS